MKHFDMPSTMCCNVLAGEQGPSCFSVKQIPDCKVIHVRFVERSEQDAPKEFVTIAETSPKKRKKNPVSSPEKGQKSLIVASKFVPKSLSVVDMLKLGKTINSNATSVKLLNFDIRTMVWCSKGREVQFVIEAKPFGSGGFREAFKATSFDSEFKDKTWVVKRYLPKAVDDIVSVGETVEQQSRKTVQMHNLARNFASQLSQEALKVEVIEEFGDTLQYKKIFLGETKSGYVTIEEFVEGSFEKYVNNNGEICGDKKETQTKKAECLAHFSFERSKKELMLLDIQGCGNDLFDPEIATVEQITFGDQESEPDKLMFCTGNLSLAAISTFIKEHKCNKYCKLLELSALEPLEQA